MIYLPERYFFAYGSLMYPNGINNRGLKYDYEQSDFITATLTNHKRGSYAVYKNQYFYSIVPNKDSAVYGMLFKVHSHYDFDKLLHDEGASDHYRNTKEGVMYDVVDVTNKIYHCWIPMEAKVYTLVHPKHKTLKSGEMDQWYIDNVWNGIKIHGPSFMSKFTKTGGIASGGGSRCLQQTLKKFQETV